MHVAEAQHDHRHHHQQLQADDDVVDQGALGHAGDQQGAHGEDDSHRRQVEDGPGAHQVGPVEGVGRGAPDVRQADAEALQHVVEVARPSGRDGGGGEAVFQDQVPGDEPGDELAERGVGVGVGRARDRDHRGQLGVAHGGEGADHPRQQEGEHDRRPRVDRRLLAGQDEDARPDHPADAQERQRSGSEAALEHVLALLGRLREQDLDRLLAEQLHPQVPPAPAGRRIQRA